MKRRILFFSLPILFLVCFFIFGQTGQARADQWFLASSTMPTARTGMSSVVIGKKIYVIGGRTYMNAFGDLNTIEVYDTEHDNWEIKTPPPTGRWGATAATVDGKLFLVAAGSPTPLGSQKVEEYNPESDSWSQKAEMPEPGWGAVSAVVDGKIYVIGGYNWPNHGMNYNREYDPSTDTWTLKSSMPTKRSWLGARAINDKIYVVGGWDQYDIIDLATLEVYDPKTDTWETKAPMPKGLRGIATAVLNNKLYVLGGEQGERDTHVLHDSVLVYDPETDVWQELDSKLPRPISVAEAQTVEGTIYLIGGYTYNQELNSVYYWPGKEKKLDPVILVPGIMGSWMVDGEWKLDPILGTYDNLWQALKLAGYEEGVTLFAFPYEWRQDNSITAYQLKQKIDEVKNLCNCGKIDVVAHSMGGIVARYYAESDYYGNDIDQLVFLGTPHKGSPKIYYTWEAGEMSDKKYELFNLLQKKIFLAEAHARGYESLFDYIQDYVKSAEQLLPNYAYLQNIGSNNFREYNQSVYPNNYPYNAFLENLNSADKINQFATSGIKIKNFIGDTGDNTINIIKLSSGEPYWPLWKHGYAEESIRLSGDGTVPEVSSSLFIPTKINNAGHRALPTKAQKQVIEYLTSKLPAIEITEVKEPEKILVVGIFSPADFIIIAPDGERLGKDFLSNQTVNEIAGAFYSGFDTDSEFAVISDPIDGEYKIELEGTGQGEYKLSISLIGNNNQVEQEFNGSIASDERREFIINYLAQDENPLSDLEPVDTEAPIVNINQPTEGKEYLHNENLIIDYTATDDFSGIGDTTIMIDDLEIATTTVDLFDYALGSHNLVIQAADKAGNMTEAQVNFKIITDIDSTISDIEKINERGWFKGKLYQPLLINALRLLKIEEKYFSKERDLIERLIKKIDDNKKLTDEQKQKFIEQYNKKLVGLEKNRAKAINRSLDAIERLLNQAKKKNQINQAGYDIIINDINYLRENL